MSLVYITFHDENIANIEKYLQFKSLKLPKFTSKYKAMVKTEAEKLHFTRLGENNLLVTSSNKHKNKSMGYAETPLRTPCDYLRKNQGLKWRREKEHTCPSFPSKPAVPRYDRSKTAAKQERKNNFINRNITLISKSAPHCKPLRYVDTPQGDTHNLLNTGLVPQYVCRRTFGKVPCYLAAHKKAWEDARRACEEEIERKKKACVYVTKTGVRQITTDERQSILAGLKTNFDTVYNQYQRLSLYTDTLAKQIRKGQLEKQLRQLEQDIFLMESNPVIYVSDF